MSIRTTVTLDEDVYKRLREESRKRGQPFKQTLNDIVREGLLPRRLPAHKAKFKFKFTTFNLEPLPGLNFDNVGELLEQVATFPFPPPSVGQSSGSD